MDSATQIDIALNHLAFQDEARRIVVGEERLLEEHHSLLFQVEIGSLNCSHLASLVFVEY
jgi:hypothetical protein